MLHSPDNEKIPFSRVCDLGPVEVKMLYNLLNQSW